MTIVQGTTNERAAMLTRKAIRLLHVANKRRDAMQADSISNIEGMLEELDIIRYGPLRMVLTVHDPKQDAIRSATSILRRLLPSLD